MYEFPEIQQYQAAPALAGLPGAALRILLYITENHGPVTITIEKLAEVCAMTEVTASESLKKLRRRNVLKTRIVGTENGKRVYRMRRTVDNLVTCEWDEEAGRVIVPETKKSVIGG